MDSRPPHIHPICSINSWQETPNSKDWLSFESVEGVIPQKGPKPLLFPSWEDQLFKVVMEIFLTASQIEGFLMPLEHLIK